MISSICEMTRKYGIRINEGIIKQVNSTRFLGIQINDKLHWKDHMPYILKKYHSAHQIYIKHEIT